MMARSPVPILSEANRKELLTLQAPADTYGLGFRIQEDESDGMKIVGHGGSVAGYNANLTFDLVSKTGAAMFRTTSYNPPMEELVKDLVAAGRQEVSVPTDPALLPGEPKR